MADLPLIFPTTPEGFCPTTWQQLVNFLGGGVAQFDGSGFSVIINQEAVPAVADQDKLWRRPSQASRGLYQFSGGAWVAVHPEPAGGDARRWWAGSLADLVTYDGGDAGAPGANSGPMWEEDTDMRGRSPMHPGTIPTANPAKVLAVDENYGEGAHTQTGQEVGPHAHPLATLASLTNADGTIDTVATGAGSDGIFLSTTVTGTPSTALSVQNNTYTTVQQAMPVIHPVRGLYCIRRTALRTNYVGS